MKTTTMSVKAANRQTLMRTRKKSQIYTLPPSMTLSLKPNSNSSTLTRWRVTWKSSMHKLENSSVASKRAPDSQMSWSLSFANRKIPDPDSDRKLMIAGRH